MQKKNKDSSRNIQLTEGNSLCGIIVTLIVWNYCDSNCVQVQFVIIFWLLFSWHRYGIYFLWCVGGTQRYECVWMQVQINCVLFTVLHH